MSRKPSMKQMLLMAASVVLMLASQFVDGELSDNMTREIIKEEIDKARKGID